MHLIHTQEVSSAIGSLSLWERSRVICTPHINMFWRSPARDLRVSWEENANSICCLKPEIPLGKLWKYMRNSQSRRLINIVLDVVTDFHSGKENCACIRLTILKQYPFVVTSTSLTFANGIESLLGIRLVYCKWHVSSRRTNTSLRFSHY